MHIEHLSRNERHDKVYLLTKKIKKIRFEFEFEMSYQVENGFQNFITIILFLLLIPHDVSNMYFNFNSLLHNSY